MTAAVDAIGTPRRVFWPAFAALVGGALAMGISPIFVRFADVGPFSSAFFRTFLALPLLYAWMRAEQARAGGVRDTGARFSGPVVAAGLFFAGDLFFWHTAILNTTVANATFFATTAPVFVAIFGWIAYRQKARPAVLAGLALCLVGGSALVGQSLALAPGHLIGDGLAFITAAFFGGYFIAIEKARALHRAARVTFYMTVLTAAILFVVAVAATLLLHQPLLPASAKGWAVLFALAFISHVGGQGLLSVALGSLPAMFSSLVIFLESVAAACFGWVLLNEPVTLVQALGGLVILLGIFVARPREGHP